MERLKSPKPEIYIFNSAGCHGHYLMYLIDRLSNKTPPIDHLPFNELGNSHNDIGYSGFVEHVPPRDQKKKYTNSNIIKIIFTNDILYQERAAMNRAGDADRDLHNVHKDIAFLQTYAENFYKKIQDLYKIESDRVPKWMLRDVYKIGFLDWEKQGSVIKNKNDIQWINENLSDTNVIEFVHVSEFFEVGSLEECLKRLDKKFSLELDLSPLAEVHEVFIEKNKILQSNQNTKITLDAVYTGKCIDLPSLDILQQAYVYAELEKKYKFVTMPLTNDFFKTSDEIIQYVSLFPNHYKAMNPNLPKFNGIDNPFFLHRQKTK